MQLSAGIFILQPLNLAITLSQSKADRHDSGVNKKKKKRQTNLSFPFGNLSASYFALTSSAMSPRAT